MNETQIYSTIMFFAGVALTHTVFFLEKKTKEKKFYFYLSSVILQVLDNINLVHMAAVEFTKDKLKTLDETETEEYLSIEGQKLSAFMELYVVLFTRAMPKQGRKYLNYKSWSEAKAVIEELRGLMNNGEGKR